MAERINCPALLLEDPEVLLLTKMLVLAPYQVPEKKAKGTRGGRCRKGNSDVTSEKAEAHSSATEDDKEEVEQEESHSPLQGEEEEDDLHAFGG